MRAVVASALGEPDVLAVEERPEPTPGPGEVLIDVIAAGVNFADLAKRRGEYPGGPEPPYVPGIAVAGRVAALPADPEGDVAGDPATTADDGGEPALDWRDELAVGDRVAAYVDGGGYAESCVAPRSRVLPLPDAIPLQEGAALPVQWLTAHNVLFEWGNLDADEAVLVHAGAGGVGSAATQLADACGATVYATASTPDKRAFARECGADAALAYEEVPDELPSRPDLVLDGVGGDAFDAGLDALAPGGRVVAYGIASGDVPRVSTPRLLFGNHAVLGYHLGHASTHQPERVLRAWPSLVETLADGAASVHLGRTLAFERAAEAHRHVADRESTGSVVLTP